MEIEERYLECINRFLDEDKKLRRDNFYMIDNENNYIIYEILGKS